MEIKQALDQFLEAFMASEAFKNYNYQRERIKKFPSLAKEINEFRKKRFEFQNYEGDDLFEKIDEFEKELKSFQEEPIIREYLAAELEICRRIQDVNAAIAGIVDIEMDLV